MTRYTHYLALLLLLAAATGQAAGARTIPLQRRPRDDYKAKAMAAKHAAANKEVVLLRTKTAAAVEGGKDVQLPAEDDDTSATALKGYEQTMNAFFAQLGFGGDQVRVKF